MATLWRIRDRSTFQALRRPREHGGTHRRSGPLRVSWVPAVDGPPRVAFAIGRAVGPAVARNRLRRRSRAHLAAVGLHPGAYLVGAAPGAAELSFEELGAHLRACLPGGGARG